MFAYCFGLGSRVDVTLACAQISKLCDFCYNLLVLASIVISGSDICTEHCKLERKGNKVILHPLLGKCFVNHRWTIKPKKMSQGTVCLLRIPLRSH